MRMPSPRPRLTIARGIALGLFVVGTILAALAQTGLTVDPSNATMLAPGTDDARATAALHAGFGGARTTLQCFQGPADQELLPAERQALDDLAIRLRADPQVAGVRAPTTADGVTVLAVDLRTDDAASAESVTAVCRNACPATLRHLATGMPLIGAAIARAVQAERTTIVPRIAVVLFFLLLCCYRSLGRTLAVLLPAALAIAWTGGLFAWSGHRLDPIAVLLEPVLLTVGVAASVHYVEAFATARQLGHGPFAATRRASRALATPALWATLTTMLGFWSLAGNAIPAVVDFGIYAALGVAVANALTFALLPSWLRFWPGTARAAIPADPAAHPWLLRLIVRHRLAIVLLTLLTSLLAAVAWLRLRVDNDPLHVLPPEHPFRRQHDELAARLGGAEVCTLLVAPDSPAQDPGRMLPFTAAVVGTPPAAGLAGPPRRSRDGSVAVPVLLAPSGSQARLPWFNEVQNRANALGLTGVTVAGASVQMARDSWRLVQTQVAGMLGTLLALGLCIGLGARSWRLGVLGLLPAGLPCLLLYGGLSALGQPMTVASAMIGSVMLGLIVDSTIHLLHHYRNERRTGSRAAATTVALIRVLRPIALSSTVLALGFLTGLGGSMTTTVDFSVLAAVTIGLAFVATAIVLPAVLLLRDPAPSPAMAEVRR
ncbi:MAG: MMPL family transporter [Planctomycetes bacterium]|nr:MMPL family transporter [Planctomycetota bacterium]